MVFTETLLNVLNSEFALEITEDLENETLEDLIRYTQYEITSYYNDVLLNRLPNLTTNIDRCSMKLMLMKHMQNEIMTKKRIELFNEMANEITN